jgi:hypothetical protein
MKLYYAEISALRPSQVTGPQINNPPRWRLRRACRLHGSLTVEDPSSGGTIEFGPEAFEHRFSRVFDLKEPRSGVRARKQTYRAERSHAPDPDRPEGYVTERVAVE